MIDSSIYRRVWCAVILQSIVDIDIQAKTKYTRLRATKKGRETIDFKIMTLLSNEAIEYIESPSKRVFGFEWVCDMCDLDRDRIRELSRTRHGRKMLLRASPRTVAARGFEDETVRPNQP